jgi:hypothetical protein
MIIYESKFLISGSSDISSTSAYKD